MKNSVLLFLCIATLSFGCNSNSKETGSSDQNKQEISVDPEKVVLVDMDVTGMTCTGCENTIKSGVSELEGVVEVKADHTSGKTYVKFDTSMVSVPEISEKIASKGYEVTHFSLESDD